MIAGRVGMPRRGVDVPDAVGVVDADVAGFSNAVDAVEKCEESVVSAKDGRGGASPAAAAFSLSAAKLSCFAASVPGNSSSPSAPS